ncbi:hypothetical protein OG233_14025 [Streptomyces sp. NBC_01218]|uniref:hypothetical protein n=1 Tax=Streptomyces sp. NBC_01218 TaxID=2903780 RepID=UPI002E1121EE|nr:hypothetical protein OG233_14025 [Streptomyces sp. NBC_01218]
MSIDTELQHLLTRPSHPQQILTTVASALLSEDPLAPLTLGTLNAYLLDAVLAVTVDLPAVVAAEVSATAARALPSIHDGETPDAYALRLHTVIRGLR